MKAAGVSLLVAMLAGSVLAQEPVTFSHQPPECVSSQCGRAAITGKIESTVPLQSVRVKFQDTTGAIYYVEMIHSGDWNFYAVLPAVLPGTTSITYGIVAITEDGTEIEGPAHSIPVTDDCPPTALTAEQTAYAMNTAVGLTDMSQTGSPSGFSCSGVVKVINLNEVMSDNAVCEEARLVKTDPCVLAEGGGGGAAGAERVAAVEGGDRSKIIGFTAAGLAVGAGGAIIYDNATDDKEPVSRYRP
jgi:hypothetical protein